MKKVLIFLVLLVNLISMKAQTNEKSTALILIDIQNDYFKGGKMELFEPEKASENAKSILGKFRDEGKPIIHIQHVSNRPGATFFLPGTAGVEIHKSVSPVAGEKVINKHFPNSFRDTGLLDYLHELEVKNLVLCGMMTHMCVDATVRAAKDYGFECTVIGNACATRGLEVDGEAIRAEGVQKAFLAALNYFYASVVSTEEYLKR